MPRASMRFLVKHQQVLPGSAHLIVPFRNNQRPQWWTDEIDALFVGAANHRTFARRGLSIENVDVTNSMSRVARGVLAYIAIAREFNADTHLDADEAMPLQDAARGLDDDIDKELWDICDGQQRLQQSV